VDFCFCTRRRGGCVPVQTECALKSVLAVHWLSSLPRPTEDLHHDQLGCHSIKLLCFPAKKANSEPIILCANSYRSWRLVLFSSFYRDKLLHSMFFSCIYKYVQILVFCLSVTYRQEFSKSDFHLAIFKLSQRSVSFLCFPIHDRTINVRRELVNLLSRGVGTATSTSDERKKY